MHSNISKTAEDAEKLHIEDQRRHCFTCKTSFSKFAFNHYQFHPKASDLKEMFSCTNWTYVSYEDTSSTINNDIIMIIFAKRWMDINIISGVNSFSYKTKQIFLLHFRSISKLLYHLTLRPSRAVVCNIFAAIASVDPSAKEISNTVFMLNAWDRKRFEEPDFKKRLEAFKIANTRLADMKTIDVQYLTPVIYNSFYFIMKVCILTLLMQEVLV